MAREHTKWTVYGALGHVDEEKEPLSPALVEDEVTAEFLEWAEQQRTAYADILEWLAGH